MKIKTQKNVKNNSNVFKNQVHNKTNNYSFSNKFTRPCKYGNASLYLLERQCWFLHQMPNTVLEDIRPTNADKANVSVQKSGEESSKNGIGTSRNHKS